MKKSTEVGNAWIDEMSPDLHRQQALLRLLLKEVSEDEIYRWLLVGCSLGRNAGDKFSDIDAGVGIADDSWPEGLQKTQELLHKIGHAEDTIVTNFPDEYGNSQHHIIAIYEHNLQLSLVVSRSSSKKGLRPDGVALYDLDNKLSTIWNPPVKITTPDQAREWAFLAWLDLADAAKYLERDSLWEALERLHRARNHTWQLAALASNLDFALYGITQIIDDHAELPTGTEKTVADFSRESIREACVNLLDILDDVTQNASKVVPFDIPKGMAQAAREMFSLT
jgi:hypothetical protein